VKARAAEGITNGAAVVLDNRTGELLAMVGSVDYWSRANDGQVNATLAYRSPGSTLKPLIYARALDIGAITPDETLFDVPVTRAGHSPQNFDREFRGPVSAPKALAWSLNIPAMEVLERVGVPEFSGFLASHRVGLRISKLGDPGLSLAIGTCSVRLLDLTRAYASLADGGTMKPVRWLTSTPAHTQGQPWISPAAAAVVLQALADETLRAPEEIDPRLQGVRGIAWKTGTSNGLRDAWTIAVAKDITVGIWVGNMDGRASRALIGSKAAAPVALELAHNISRYPINTGRAESNAWPGEFAGTVVADACDITGLPATPNCPGHTARRFLKNHLRDHRCRAHELVQLDAHTGLCLCNQCRTGTAEESAIRLHFPPEIATWLRSTGHPWSDQLVPAHNPACAVGGNGEVPAIVNPAPGTEIVLLDELPLEQQKIALSARTANPAEQLYWFVNGSLAGTTAASDSLVVTPQPGRNRIVCTNSRGRSTETWFLVQKQP
jgi:penicillin-binding protein 1C